MDYVFIRKDALEGLKYANAYAFDEKEYETAYLNREALAKFIEWEIFSIKNNFWAKWSTGQYAYQGMENVYYGVIDALDILREKMLTLPPPNVYKHQFEEAKRTMEENKDFS